MPIEFRCGQCNKLLRTPDETAGKQAKCPECGAVTQIPSAPSPHGSESPFGLSDSPPPAAGGGEPSPFAPDIPPPEGSSVSDNPYQSPGDYQAAAMPGGMVSSPELMAYAAARVSAPAVALIVVGSLGLLLQVVGLVFRLFTVAGAAGNANQDEMILMLAGGAGALIGLFSIVMQIVMIVGAVKMKNLAHYGLAMTAAILGVVPCTTPCCLGIPFGIWALVVLSDGRVQAAFSAARGGE